MKLRKPKSITSTLNETNPDTHIFKKEEQRAFFHQNESKSIPFFPHIQTKPFFNTVSSSFNGGVNTLSQVETPLSPGAVGLKQGANNSVESPAIQTKCETCEDHTIQRQEQPDATVTEELSPAVDESPSTGPESGPTHTGRCYTNPEFPNFGCLAAALKLDVDENLWNNAHHFYRVASLHPGDNELMWNTFLRYGLGINLLQTSFGFLGADETLGTALSYGTGIGLKSFEFFQNGVLQLDVPIPLGRGVNLDFQLDLNADPDNLTNIQGASAGVGFSGHF